MRSFYCLLLMVSMFIGCSKDSPQNDQNLVTAKFSMDSPGGGQNGYGYLNKFELYYSKSIAGDIDFKVRFIGKVLDTVFIGKIEQGFDGHPAAYGEPVIVGFSKSFNFISNDPANTIELISISCNDPKYKLKMLPPRNLAD